MRLIGLLLSAFAFIQQADAADMGGILRGAMFEMGSPSYFHWRGYYAGGHAGYSSAGMDTPGTTNNLIDTIINNTDIDGATAYPSVPSSAATTAGTGTYGGFVGYNAQWDDIVLGVEFNYSHGKFAGTGVAESRSFLNRDGFQYDIRASASSSVVVHDFATFRGRAAYAYGRYLPYAMLGIAVGRVDTLSSATVAYTATDISGLGRDPPSPFRSRASEGKNDIFTLGWTAGLGIDIALMRGTFVRAEFERTGLVNNGVNIGINTVRAGLGMKF